MGNEGKRVGLLCDTLVFFGVDGGAKRLLSSYSFGYTIHDQRRGKKKKKKENVDWCCVDWGIPR